jgi:dynein heavy chain
MQVPPIRAPPDNLQEIGLPVLLKRFSWTKAAPFKEERYHRKVSDSIANNYSPRAVDLTTKYMGKRAGGESASLIVKRPKSATGAPRLAPFYLYS